MNASGQMDILQKYVLITTRVLMPLKHEYLNHTVNIIVIFF